MLKTLHSFAGKQLEQILFRINTEFEDGNFVSESSKTKRSHHEDLVSFQKMFVSDVNFMCSVLPENIFRFEKLAKFNDSQHLVSKSVIIDFRKAEVQGEK